jgi:hypothetical protein
MCVFLLWNKNCVNSVDKPLHMWDKNFIIYVGKNSFSGVGMHHCRSNSFSIRFTKLLFTIASSYKISQLL